jgi:hypothetical protein
MQWFRLHNKLLNDPTVQGLSSDQFKVYINLLCYASSIDRGGYVGTLDETAFALRETIEHVTSCFNAFQGVGLIVTNETDDETFQIPQWKKKQYESDSSTERVKKHREKVKRSKTVTVTPSDTEADTDTEQKQKESKTKRFTPPSQKDVANYFFERQSPAAVGEADKFIDFYTSKNWMVGKNKMKDWKASVRNWMRKDETDQRTNSKESTGDRVYRQATDTSWAD